jgi:RNA-splicing ligase RtcB
MRSGLSRKEIQGKMMELVEALFHNIPSGVVPTGRI